jgi:hypothetical protein
MGLQEAEPMSQLFDTAQRLRMVRAARRRFFLNWALEAKPRTRRTRQRLAPSSQRQLRLFDDL